ncbi:PREDICTED: uncharacterized protein LOC106817776 [Priapulus caudatus]|uniref:Uncharacterized protein LOC106817776 n=1 Tax=Priapulus caudatus TaxID=37621 RepID=A0ABM1F0J1_PRICU|nr:PREDICTED: uncharacterized protein LOC106817776 [Priapulus caudatus]
MTCGSTVSEKNSEQNRLTIKRVCFVSPGNHILHEPDLTEFHKVLLSQDEGQKGQQTEPDKLIRAAVAFVRALPSIDNMDAITEIVFKSATRGKEQLAEKLKQSVLYYQNGSTTRDAESAV